MVTPEQARSLALELPETIEQDHHGRPSFRVAGRIFATLWNEHQLNVMLDQDGIRTAARSEPEVCAERAWGKRLGAVSVDLRRASASIVADLLSDAWEAKAPSRLTRKARPTGKAGRSTP